MDPRHSGPATGALYAFPTIASYLAAASGSNPFAYVLYGQTLGNPSLNYNSLFSGLFVQDSWKPLRNLTVVYGLRYDIYKMPDAYQSSPFQFSQHFNMDTNNAAPRLGLAYGFGKNERTVIRASTGIFYDAPQTDPYRRALLNDGSPAFFTLTAVPGLPYAPTFPNVLPSVPAGFKVPPGDITTISPKLRHIVFRQCEFLDQPRNPRRLRRDGFVPLYKGNPSAHLPQHQPGSVRHLPRRRPADFQQYSARLSWLRQHTLGGVGRNSNYHGMNILISVF